MKLETGDSIRWADLDGIYIKKVTNEYSYVEMWIPGIQEKMLLAAPNHEILLIKKNGTTE